MEPVFGISFPSIMGLERAAPWLVASFFLGYVMGSAPFGLILARVMGVSDPRQKGSGNLGAANMTRNFGVGAGVLTLALDAMKGAAPAWIAFYFLSGAPGAALAGLGAFLGHCFSLFLGLRGGKGVATGFGVLCAWRWEVGLGCAVAWLLAAIPSRIASVGAFGAVAAAPPLLAYFEEWTYFWPGLIMALVVVWAHRANISRLVRGEEPRFSRKGR